MGDPSNTVFVTGASGFIGRHVVQMLSRHDYKIRALVRRIPAHPFEPSVEVVLGDLTKPETYGPSLSAASAVVHTALTDGFSGDLQVTSRLYSQASEAGIRKFVHLSSIAIYGNPASGTVTEETPPIPSQDNYSRTKLAIEEALRARFEIPEVVILRLGCVYGPGGGWWTHGLLNLMERGQVISVNGGTGTANLIHVEDVGSMVLPLLARSNPAFDIFNLTDGTPVTWKRYFAELEKILGRTATVPMNIAEARRHGRKWLQPSGTRRVIRKLLGARRVHPLGDYAIDQFASSAIYSNQKARTTLGFQPRYDLESGIQSVADDLVRAKSRST